MSVFESLPVMPAWVRHTPSPQSHTHTHLWEVLLDHRADVLRVVEVQRCINLVQDVDGCRLEPA